jgi:hypothetical protein
VSLGRRVVLFIAPVFDVLPEYHGSAVIAPVTVLASDYVAEILNVNTKTQQQQNPVTVSYNSLLVMWRFGSL